mmetsp:Transcript_106405/g.343273  ORF Transcript_106405/g.343273 Transcript_106405/m.343273 type:complete len:323 (-) Transcript_106405:51-1019(-)
MLGRKPRNDRSLASTAPGKTRDSKGPSKKRKWQEELSEDDSGSEGKITKADMDAWRATIAQEERQEQLEREKKDREERERARKQKELDEAKQRQREREEAEAQREAEEARKVVEEAESERRRQEEALAPPGPLPPDRPGSLPPGMRAEKMHLYKTTYCKRWEQGNCQFGAACHFAHGERELRGRPPKGSPPGTMSVALPEELQRPLPSRAGAVVVPPPVPPPPVLPPQVGSVPGLRGPFSAGFSGIVPQRGPGRPVVVPPSLSPTAPPVPTVVPPPSVPPSGLVAAAGLQQPGAQPQASATLNLLGSLFAGGGRCGSNGQGP